MVFFWFGQLLSEICGRWELTSLKVRSCISLYMFIHLGVMGMVFHCPDEDNRYLVVDSSIILDLIVDPGNLGGGGEDI